MSNEPSLRWLFWPKRLKRAHFAGPVPTGPRLTPQTTTSHPVLVCGNRVVDWGGSVLASRN